MRIVVVENCDRNIAAAWLRVTAANRSMDSVGRRFDRHGLVAVLIFRSSRLHHETYRPFIGNLPSHKPWESGGATGGHNQRHHISSLNRSLTLSPACARGF